MLSSAVAIVLLWGQPAPALPCPSASATLEQLLSDSQSLQQNDENAAAAACFAQVVERAVAAGDRATEARGRLGMAQTSVELANYARASDEAARARALFDSLEDRVGVARADTALGASVLSLGQRSKAIALYQSALAAFEAAGAEPEYASALVSYTMLTELPGDEESALLDRAIAIARRLGLRRVEARALHSRADKAFGQGQFDAAIRDLGSAIELFRSENQRANLADAYVSMGRIHRAHGQPEAAIGFYDQAAAIQEKTGDVRGLVQSTNAKAIALAVLGRQTEARAAYERALEMARKTGAPRLINFQQGNLAGSYADAGDHATAIRLLEEVIARETDAYILAYRHSGLAYNYNAIGQPARALEHAHQAIKFAEQTDNRELLPGLLITRARVLRALNRVPEALADARAGTRAIETMRARLVPLDFMKRGFSESNQEIYGLTISLMHARGEEAESLVMSEQARARAFLDLLASRSMVEQRPAVPLMLPSVEPGDNDPSLASFAAAAPASAGDIARIAARLRSTILAYWVGSDELFIWVAAEGSPVRSARVPVGRKELQRVVTAALPTPIGADLEALRTLHRWLIDPVAKWLPPAGHVLTIVPHGSLFRLSFAALQDSRGAYLVERYALGYSPSISAFMFTERLADRARHLPSSYLLVADPKPLPKGTDASPIEALPASVREARGIRAALGARTSSLVLSGQGASEARVREAMRGRRIIHLATHAFVNDEEPLDSFLALGASSAAAATDGRLSVRELYDLDLQSELVIMSACRTASGRLSGDGIAGLSRALFYAGAASVIATQWDVADEPSAELMVRFYEKWRGEADKRHALRNAQLELIRSLRQGSVVVRTKLGTVRLREQPFNWAGYLLFGEP
ncbi:MAG TPA: CHAT domain-containing tetratricopeptide repeat protein [Gemmatimonadaceae bacterium]